MSPTASRARRTAGLLLAAALLGAAAPAAAAESPRWGSFQLQFGQYRPDIDGEFAGKGSCITSAGTATDCTPFADVFGTNRTWLFQAQAAKSLFVEKWGTLDLGVGAGYWSKSGKGLLAIPGSVGTGAPSGDSTALKVIPMSLSLTYRFDPYVDRFPLVPYARVSLLHYQWWVTNGSGGTASDASGKSGSGGTNGWGLGLGVAFLLDFLDPGLAREMDRDTGINHTYLFVEFDTARVKDFGSSKSWDLSQSSRPSVAMGLLFVF